MLGKFMCTDYDKVLNTRFLKKGSRWNGKIKIKKSHILRHIPWYRYEYF